MSVRETCKHAGDTGSEGLFKQVLMSVKLKKKHINIFMKHFQNKS